jgi:hypothetical protein
LGEAALKGYTLAPKRVFLLMGADLGSPHKSALAFGANRFYPY